LRVLNRLGVSLKEAAYLMGMAQSQLSEWIAGTERPQESKFRRIGREFTVCMAVDELEDDGGYVVLPRSEVSQLVLEVRAMRTQREEVSA
jgi:transcriptional regulator with XRE-family HTH domain